MNKKTIKAKITRALRSGIAGTKSQIAELVPATFTAGKLYEAYVLGLVCERLKTEEGCMLTLVGGKEVVLKSSPGPINAAYPHIKVTKRGKHIADIWTDIEFTALSAAASGKSTLSLGEFHELDIAVVRPGAEKRPLPDEILLAVECKNTGYQKNLLREILGVRRELSYLQEPQNTAFSSWPRTMTPAKPPSCVVVYSTDPGVVKYAAPGNFFGIDFHHAPL